MNTFLVAGGWGQNIGNAFFNLAGRHLLQAAGYNVTFVQDSPAYWTFRNEKRGAYPHAWSPLSHHNFDLIVLQGPLFTRNFANIWARTLVELNERGIQWAAMSAAFRSYSAVEMSVARDVINAAPPLFISTRDDVSYGALRAAFPAVRRGIDSAFFVPWVHKPSVSARASDPFVSFTFDHFGEPRLDAAIDGLIEIGPERFTATYSKWVDAWSSRGKALAYIGQTTDWRQLPRTVGGHTIVRPEHRTNPHLPFKIYRRPGGLASDEPWTYLTVYSNTALTLADRVHACVATLAYGHPAMLHNPTTRRNSLFDAVGAAAINGRPVTVSRDRLAEEYARLVTFLQLRAL